MNYGVAVTIYVSLNGILEIFPFHFNSLLVISIIRGITNRVIIIRDLLKGFSMDIKYGMLKNRLPSKFIEKIRFSHHDLVLCLRAMNDSYSPFNSFMEFFTTLEIIISMFSLISSNYGYIKISLTISVIYSATVYSVIAILATKQKNMVREIIKDLFKMNTAFIDQDLHNEIYMLISQLNNKPFTIIGSFDLVINRGLIIKLLNDVINNTAIFLQMNNES
ncbi:uncharacterized protein LOC142318186 [Lycorma delicatula]|uniref:uncharacterized protein LOC142318186 n=1 Tax=Lycorma delicatula TaxID=130591 RepID=UPI003F514EA9